MSSVQGQVKCHRYRVWSSAITGSGQLPSVHGQASCRQNRVRSNQVLSGRVRSSATGTRSGQVRCYQDRVSSGTVGVGSGQVSLEQVQVRSSAVGLGQIKCHLYVHGQVKCRQNRVRSGTIGTGVTASDRWHWHQYIQRQVPSVYTGIIKPR